MTVAPTMIARRIPGVTAWLVIVMMLLGLPALAQSGRAVSEVTGITSNDVLNVRSGPGTSYRIVGALGNRDRVHVLNCQMNGSSRWCQIEMMTDMKERGWVNARYLTRSAAVQLPSKPGPMPEVGGTTTHRVQFAPGTSGARFAATLPPGASHRYLLGARNGQMLEFRIDNGRRGLSYQIFNPDRSFLLDQVGAGQVYRGQLWQSGDHVIEVINRSDRSQSYTAVFSVR